MSPNSTRAFAVRLAEDDAFRALVTEDADVALAEYDLAGPGLVPDEIVLPEKAALSALWAAREPKPEPPKPPKPQPINVQLFDPA